MQGKMRVLPLFAVGVLFAAGCQAAPQNKKELFADSYRLRCYGPVTAEEMPKLNKYGDYELLRITSQDPGKAVLMLSKLLSDFTTLPTVKKYMVKSGDSKLEALSFDSGRQMLPVLKKGDNVVDVYTFKNRKALDDFLQKASKDLAGAMFVNDRRHPYFMDFWDRHNMGFWYRLQVNHKGWTDKDDLKFLKNNDVTVNTIVPVSSIAAMGRRNNIGYKINRWFDVNDWVYEKYPEAAFKSDPDITLQSDYYGDVPFAENPIERIQMGSVIDYFKQFINDEYLLTITAPHGETGPNHSSYLGARGRGKFSRRDFVHYLRDIRKISLKELGKRWHNDPNYYGSWDDVKFPRERLFYGWKEGESQNLAGTWKLRMTTRKDGEDKQVYNPKYDDSHWLSFQQPGSQYLAQWRPHNKAKSTSGWVRYEFTPEKRFVKSKKPVYLTICPFNYARYNDPDTIYLNGKKVADLTFGYGGEWGQFEVNKYLKRGKNTLTLYLAKGYVGGPVFLTFNKMEDFPTRDAGLNAQRYDLEEWIANCCARANKRYIEYMRGIDGKRPVKLMAFHSMVDVMMPYVAMLGVFPHCTGEGAFFRPWDKRNGFLYGVQDSSEPGGPAGNLEKFKRYFFIMTFEGMNAHDYFWDVNDVLKRPDQKKHYEKNVPYYKLMGRFNLKKPEIAVTRSLKADRYYKHSTAFDNDLTRGDIQQAHYGYVVCYEPDIGRGVLDDYKVIVDNNFHTLEPKDLKALENWVKQGGFLVLNQRSGRNTYLKKNSWPISSMTGCKAEIRPETGTLTFEKNIPILKQYAGKTFKNEGKAINWQKYDYYTDSIALTPVAKDVKVLAKYSDGKAAVIMRKYGKGKVIVLGSAFYRDSSDQNGFYVGSQAQADFYSNLFADLGVEPLVENSNIKLWAERFISNNGSTEMLIIGNQNTKETLKNEKVAWKLDFKPKRVFDPVTGKDIKVAINGNKVIIDNVDLAPQQMRYYAVERLSQSGQDTLVHWLNRQQDLWRAVPAGREAPPVDPSMPLVLRPKFMVKQFSDEKAARAALGTTKYDSSWQSLPKGMWSIFGLKTGKDIWGVHKGTFTASDAWLKDLRGAEPIWSPWPLRGVLSEIYVNDLLILKNDKVVADSQTILKAVKPGVNEFKVLCRGRKSDGEGGFMGEFRLRRVPAGNGEEVNLSKNWTIYLKDNDTILKSFPCRVKCVMARKTVMIPEKYRNKTVWLEVKAAKPDMITFVSTNGRVRYHGRFGKASWLGAMWINITPDIKFGAENDLIIGNREVLTWKNFEGKEIDFEYAKLIFCGK